MFTIYFYTVLNTILLGIFALKIITVQLNTSLLGIYTRETKAYIHIETTMRDHLKPECTSSKSLQTINAGEGVEKREPSYTDGGNVNWCSHYRKQYGSSCSSVQFSHSVVSDSLQPHESQHTRPPCPSPTPGVHSNSCLLSQ